MLPITLKTMKPLPQEVGNAVMNKTFNVQKLIQFA